MSVFTSLLLLSFTGCILASESCDPVCNDHETYVKCKPSCEPTCQHPDCPDEPCTEPCVDGCVCEDGYIRLTKNGKCVKIDHCPPGCNDDDNATAVSCPDPCPSTCDVPNAAHHNCKIPCKVVGCQCNSGYLQNEQGKCILPEDCPCGDPCDPNGHFSNCRTYCDKDYCPDKEYPEPCSPPKPCYNPGCMCDKGYVRKSRYDEQCIPTKDCPPINCTGPHTVYNPNPPHPNAEKCKKNDKPADDSDCDYPPRCVCEEGYCRNGSNICVPAPGSCNGDPHAVYVECKPSCERTCQEPDCPDVPCTEPCVSGCVCKDGYIREKKNGKCIKVEHCPPGCHGDYNSTAVYCPDPCPSTCDNPNAAHHRCLIPCKDIGCQCNTGYLQNEHGVCILPEDCPCGDPCDPNGHFSNCRTYCDDDYCPVKYPEPCYPPDHCYNPGCMCDKGYVRKSRDNETCIPLNECPCE